MADEWGIEALSYDKLGALNRDFVARLKQLNALRSQYHMFALNRGRRVSFDASPQHGELLIAAVLKPHLTGILDGPDPAAVGE